MLPYVAPSLIRAGSHGYAAIRQNYGPAAMVTSSLSTFFWMPNVGAPADAGPAESDNDTAAAAASSVLPACCTAVCARSSRTAATGLHSIYVQISMEYRRSSSSGVDSASRTLGEYMQAI